MPDPIATEELVKSSEAHFAFIADYIPTLVWVANADGWIYWYNRRWYEYTGTTPRQMEGWGWQSVHDPAVLPSVLENWRSSIATGQPFEMVFPLRGADGVFRPFMTRVNTIRDSAGKIIRWVGINTNIAGQRQAEAELVEKDARLRAAFRQTYSFMVLLSADGTILEANDAALQASAADRSEVIGRKFWEAVWWSSLPEEIESVKRSILRAANGESVREECRYTIKGGAIRFADRTLSPVKEADGSITMVVASGIDTTEQKELRDSLEERIKLRTRDLEEKNDQLRDLSARLLRSQDEERRRIARDLHDSVGQMVAALTMNIGMVLKQVDKLTPDAAAAIRQNLEITHEISTEIRNISHLLHPPLLEELGILSSLGSYAEGFAGRSKIKVSLELPQALDNLPKGMDLAIFRIVQECLTNVYRHSGSPNAFIRVSPNAGQISIQVRDEGKGMPSSTITKTSGVGLRGIRERVRELGGTLTIESSDKGTIVTATLPRASAAGAVVS
ncbi:MAG: hypothetical protein PVS2B2_16410 [Candidatus Acidiferrum sp.]